MCTIPTPTAAAERTADAAKDLHVTFQLRPPQAAEKHASTVAAGIVLLLVAGVGCLSQMSKTER